MAFAAAAGTSGGSESKYPSNTYYDYDAKDEVQTTQPPPAAHYPDRPPGVPPGTQGPVTVRNMTQADAEFAAHMTIDAFRGKFEWAVGKNR